jgi:hypothetical protein
MVANPFCRALSRESDGHLSCMSCSIRLSCDSYHRPIVRFARKVGGRPLGVARNKSQKPHWSQTSHERGETRPPRLLIRPIGPGRGGREERRPIVGTGARRQPDRSGNRFPRALHARGIEPMLSGAAAEVGPLAGARN